MGHVEVNHRIGGPVVAVHDVLLRIGRQLVLPELRSFYVVVCQDASDPVAMLHKVIGCWLHAFRMPNDFLAAHWRS